MRIPKRVNDAWDWAEHHIRGLTITAILVVVGVLALFLPVFAVLAAGLVAGGVAVYLRMSGRQRRLRAEIDELLRQNGALRHQRTVLASGVMAAEEHPTQALMVIPAAEDEDEPEPDSTTTRTLPLLSDED